MSAFDSNPIVDVPRVTQAPSVAIELYTASSSSESASLTPPHAPVNTDPTTLHHNQELPDLQIHIPLSPTSSTPATALNSCASSVIFDSIGQGYLSFHSLKWRLSSGYFACFLAGWADGGMFHAITVTDKSSILKIAL